MQYISYTVTNTHYEFQQTSSWQNSDEDNSIKEQSFLKFYEERALNEHNLRQSTRFCHLSTLKHLARFAPDLQFKDLTYQFLIDFENYLLSIPLHKNTIAKHMKQLKRYLNSAIGQGLIDIRYHPFLNYKIQMEDTSKAYLTPEELNSIEQLPLHSCHGLGRCRDIFLFSCYTGLRFSDIVRLIIYGGLLSRPKRRKSLSGFPYRSSPKGKPSLSSANTSPTKTKRCSTFPKIPILISTNY